MPFFLSQARVRYFIRRRAVLSAWALGTILVGLQPASAQTNAPESSPTAVKSPTEAPQSVPSLPILSVALPPQARLRLDIDARDEDVLGMVKAALNSFKGHNMKPALKVPEAPNAISPRGDITASRDLQTAAVLQLLSDVDLDTLLQPISHLRVVVFETPLPQRTALKGKPVAPTVPPSVMAYYEQAYLGKEGGRRIARADLDEMQMLTVGFPQKGFAVVL